MKLSEKGLKKFERHEQIKKLGYVSLIDEIEFESGDFKGMVCLTVEEANILLTMVDDFPELSVANRLINRLQERIKQAKEKE